MRGRFPLGWNPNDADFNTLLKEGGAKTHTLTVAEMPEHDHTAHGKGKIGGGISAYLSTTNNTPHRNRYSKGGGADTLGASVSVDTSYRTGDTGGNQPHNNMPPYRIIKFIEFVGF